MGGLFLWMNKGQCQFSMKYLAICTINMDKPNRANINGIAFFAYAKLA
mgnify:FL=1